MKRYALMVAVALALCAAPVAAQNLVASPVLTLSTQQQTAASLQPGDAYRLSFDYDAAVMASHPVTFRFYVDDVKVKDLTAADYAMTNANGLNTYVTNAGAFAAFTQAQLGSHTLAVSAVDATGVESTTKASIAVVVGWMTPPAPPSGLKLYTPKVALNPNTGEMKFYLVADGGGH